MADPYLIAALRHSDTTMVAPGKTRPRSPTLDGVHKVVRALGLRSRCRGHQQEDMDSESDVEVIPTAPVSGTTAGPTPPAGSVQALLPAWKRGHCSGEGSCPGQDPWPAADTQAPPAVRNAAAGAPLRYRLAQGWIQGETTRGSVNIETAVDRVAKTGHIEVPLHTRSRHSGRAEGLIAEPTGIVLVLAVDLVPGVLHESCWQRALLQWAIEVYNPPRAWPLSTWAVFAIIWHLAPQGSPTDNTEDIAQDLHTWPVDQDFS